MPGRPWSWRQSWLDVLFAHWPVPAATLRPLVPDALSIQEFEGTAWIGVIPFHMEGVSPRWLPARPWLFAFPEINVRTYVEMEGKPGVWFFSLDATNPLAVWSARRFFHLPYYRADISRTTTKDRIKYRSERRPPTDAPAKFAASYGAVADEPRAAPGSLDHWLTERYCLYAYAPDGALFRLEVHHPPWPLQRCQAEIETNSMTRPLQINLPPRPETLHFAKRVDVILWSPVRLQ